MVVYYIGDDADDIFLLALFPLAVVAVAGEDEFLGLYVAYAVHHVATVVVEKHDVANFEILSLGGGDGGYAHLCTVAAHKGTHTIPLYADDYALTFGEELFDVGKEYIVADAFHRATRLFAAKYGVVRQLGSSCIRQTLQVIYGHLHQHLGEGCADVILKFAVVCERGWTRG